MHFYSMQLTEAFAEMMFKHGFVHCDPHAANVMIRPLPSASKSIFGESLSTFSKRLLYLGIHWKLNVN